MLLDANLAMRTLLAAVLALLAIGCSHQPAAQAPPVAPAGPTILETAQGLASYYARSLDGLTTASGIALDLDAMVAAHPTYPFGTIVRVSRPDLATFVDVTIVDRGPAAGPRKEGVIIDLSRAAATALTLLEAGRARVTLEVLKWGDPPSRSAADSNSAAASGSGLPSPETASAR
jgi:rare lipoprotein A